MDKKKIIGKLLNITAPLLPKKNREIAFKLLCKVNRVPISEDSQEFFNTAETIFIEVGTQKIALHKWGNGTKNILFLHGWMSHSKRWKPYVESLDLSKYTLYSVDAPAHGLSTGKSLNIEAYRYGVATAIEKIGSIETLICHSLGSLVGAYMYLSDPKIDIKSYIIMGAPSGMDSIFGFFQEMIGLSEKALKNLGIKVNSLLKVPSEELTMANFFRSVDVPVLVIHEKSDPVTPFSDIENAVKQNKTIETFFTTGQDHNLTGAETVVKAVQFINQPKKTEKEICI